MEISNDTQERQCTNTGWPLGRYKKQYEGLCKFDFVSTGDKLIFYDDVVSTIFHGLNLPPPKLGQHPNACVAADHVVFSPWLCDRDEIVAWPILIIPDTNIILWGGVIFPDTPRVLHTWRDYTRSWIFWWVIRRLPVPGHRAPLGGEGADWTIRHRVASRGPVPPAILQR